jgi:hypothetical protein
MFYEASWREIWRRKRSSLSFLSLRRSIEPQQWLKVAYRVQICTLLLNRMPPLTSSISLVVSVWSAILGHLERSSIHRLSHCLANTSEWFEPVDGSNLPPKSLEIIREARSVPPIHRNREAIRTGIHFFQENTPYILTIASCFHPIHDRVESPRRETAIKNQSYFYLSVICNLQIR